MTASKAVSKATKPAAHPALTLTGTVAEWDEVQSDKRGNQKTDLVPALPDTPEEDVVMLAGERLMVVEIGRNAPGQTSYAAGDVTLYSKLDANGRHSVSGGHSNFGYSGYFKASVFDGKQWRNLKIWDFVPEADRQFATQKDKPTTEAKVIAAIAARAGHAVVWGDRTYELAESVGDVVGPVVGPSGSADGSADGKPTESDSVE
jgi:hypothetical protein